jgi:hypothetical protein
LFSYGLLPAYKFTSIDEDELLYLQTVQESITALRLVKAHHPWLEVKVGPDQALARISQIGGSASRFRHLLLMITVPNYSKATIVALRAETARQMTLTAIALKRFELRNGHLPSDLASLVPKFLSAPPPDYMSGKTLHYRLRVDGSFLLYSVGEDGKDDRGDPNPPSGKNAGLWEGRDAVWPSAGKMK